MIFGVGVGQFGLMFIVPNHRDCPNAVNTRREKFYRGLVGAVFQLVTDEPLLESVRTLKSALTAWHEGYQPFVYQHAIYFLFD